MSDKLSTWLINELNKRSWSARELARRINLSHTSVSRYIEDSRTPTPKVCRRIAKIFNVPAEEIMRLAGHLPAVPKTIAEEEETLAILRTLPAPTRATILQMLRGLRSATTYPIAPAPTHTLAEPNIQYPIPNIQYPISNTQPPIPNIQCPIVNPPSLSTQIAPLIEQYPALSPLFDQALETLPQHAVQALIYNVQIWINSSSKDTFTDLHRQLSDFLAIMSS